MTTPILDPPSTLSARLRARFDRPISNFWCVISWLGATAVFFGFSVLLGGPSEGDVAESVYGTWSVAHGNLGCVYPVATVNHLNDLANPFALAAPLYPLVSGFAATLTRIGHAVAFPSARQLGPQCDRAFNALFTWSVKSSAILPTIRLSYFVWPVLMVGVIALVRASGRGRRGWEPLALFLVACTPPAVMCLTYYFHPQDLLAMGLVLVGVARFLKRKWFWAGVFVGLAFCSQQFALLVAAPLVVIAPGRERIRFLLGALCAIVIIDVPLLVATSGRAVKTILFGSSRAGANIRSRGGTVLWEANLHGVLLFVISRVVPVVASMALAWWASRRLGARLLSPVPVISLVVTSLTTRLVFEVNSFGYYFMAAAIGLIVLDVAGGRIRGPMIAWLALVTLAFNPVHAGFVSNLTGWSLRLHAVFPIVLFAVAVAAVMLDAVWRRIRLYKVVWVVVAALTGESQIWGLKHSVIQVSNWTWQLVLVPTALALAVSPLVNIVKSRTSLEVPATR